jgi:phosphatidylglycerophosphatase A
MSASTTRGLLLLAQGLGLGRLNPGPGTWGSLGGVLLTAALLLVPHPAFYIGTVLILTAASIPICSVAERALGETDPGSVVLDEIIAVPIAFSGYAVHWWAVGATPRLEGMSQWWPALLAAFVLFRIFDIWKPWPIRRLQNLHGGLGIVLDDVAAALVSALLLGIGTPLLFYVRLIA